MRTVLAGVLAILAVALPATAGSFSQLTLAGPKATRFNHEVDLTGRVQPAVDGAVVRLYRGSSLVARTRARAGSYRFHLRLGRPGPFHAESQGASSAPVTVRIEPALSVAVSGIRAAGSPLRLRARIRPQFAGRLRVSVLRDGRQTFSRVYFRDAVVELGTPEIQRIRVLVETVASPGFGAPSRTVGVSLRAPRLAYGSVGPLVTGLVRRLGSLGYVVPGQRSRFDGDVLQSVYAFEKAQGLPRTGVVGAAFWRRLQQPAAVVPRYRLPADHLEVDKRRQILLVVRGGEVRLISPVSTAGIAGYYTPEGRFAISRKIPGYDPSPLGVLYKPMYFYGGYAIHGNPSVPPYPASHGCVRVPNYVIERLFTTEPYGETVFVYS